MRNSQTEYDLFFKPESVCVIGASQDENTLSFAITQNLLNGGYKGSVYLVNKKGGSAFGIPIFKDIDDIQQKPDLALIFIPAKFVSGVVEQLAIKGTRHFIIYSAGFAEAGQEGKENQLTLQSIIKKYFLKVIGPNCMGILDNHNLLVATNWFYTSEKGNVALISQSGAYGMIFSYMAKNRHIGFSKFINIGNSLGVGFVELLEFLENDDDTQIIILYIEGLSESSEFIKICRRVVAKKPIVLLKAGSTEYGQIASKTHTGSLSGDNDLFETICREAGVLIAQNTEELMDIIQVLQYPALPKSKKVAVISPSGGPCIIASDACYKYGLELAEFSSETNQKLEKHLPFYAAKRNPLDITTQISYENSFEILKAVIHDENVDGLILMVFTEVYTEAFESTVRYLKSSGKPFVVATLEEPELYKHFRKEGIPLFFSPERAVIAYSYGYKYAKIREAVTKSCLNSSSKGSASTELDHYLKNTKRCEVSEYFSRKILGEYNVPMNKAVLVDVDIDPDELNEKLRDFHFPLVMKIDKEGIYHRSDVGGVIKNITNIESAYKQLVAFQEKFGIDSKALIVEMVPDGIEFIIGFKRDYLGSFMIFGLGGIFSEVLKDVSFSMLPLSYEKAINLIESIKGSKLLKGYRGMPKVNIDLLVELLLKLSEIISNNPQIQELDLNPVIAYDNKIIIADAFLLVKEE